MLRCKGCSTSLLPDCPETRLPDWCSVWVPACPGRINGFESATRPASSGGFLKPHHEASLHNFRASLRRNCVVCVEESPFPFKIRRVIFPHRPKKRSFFPLGSFQPEIPGWQFRHWNDLCFSGIQEAVSGVVGPAGRVNSSGVIRKGRSGISSVSAHMGAWPERKAPVEKSASVGFSVERGMNLFIPLFFFASAEPTSNCQQLFDGAVRQPMFPLISPGAIQAPHSRRKHQRRLHSNEKKQQRGKESLEL